MKVPSKPEVGAVISYSYLWQNEQREGAVEGRKTRPGAVILTTAQETSGTVQTYVAPITHTPPKSTNAALEIPALLKTRLGLDDERSWVVTTELNRFEWPGFDLAPAVNRDSCIYGVLPGSFVQKLRESIRRNQQRGQVFIVSR